MYGLNRLFQAISDFGDRESAHNIPQNYPTTIVHPESPPDIGQVRGQIEAKKALLIAAAGRHNILMIGPPGEGKSFLASTIPSFLPKLSDYQQARLKLVYDCVGLPCPDYPPFRNVGPVIREASLIGGGRSEPIPGEISLAHQGILFMDELPQFGKPLIDSLRQPLEDRYVSVTRSGITRLFPCDIQLIAAMNPCPCGYLGLLDSNKSELCNCSEYQIEQYRRKVSGPILDRIDLVVWLAPLTSAERFEPDNINQSKLFLAAVLSARNRQLMRQRKLNYRLGPSDVFSPENSLRFTDNALKLFKETTSQPKYSTRKTIRLARIARTIADIGNQPSISTTDIELAASFVDNQLFSMGD